ncbi:uncharacterized protein LOC127010919 [Drosophila biarmipes]|uniref:uncharacterized protein LOC127010919 n=1 Tax=Drosophila biarmipes TaxID=125945 RepID=UPI0021CCAE8A|nr:uncharacterized protein LOC127010919 [Drosophila biarmipes]
MGPTYKLTRFTWSNEAVESLFEQWEDNLPGLRGDRKNTQIYREIAEKLKDFGPNHKEVKNKMENMVKRYRRELDRLDPSSGRPSTWEHFDRLSYILEATNRVADIHFESKDFLKFAEASCDIECSEESNSSFAIEISFGEPSGPLAKNSRSDLTERLVEAEERKAAALEKIAEDSAKFQHRLLHILERIYRK